MPDPSSHERAQAAIAWRTLLSRWKTAFNNRDTAAIVALFAHDALFQGLGPDLLVGSAAIRNYYENVPLHVKASVSGPEAHGISAETACGFADVTFEIPGAPPRHIRLSFCCALRGGEWRIHSYHAAGLAQG